MYPGFKHHKLNGEGMKKCEAISQEFNKLLEALESMTPTGNREFALVKTHLEQACFYAKKSVALQPHNQEAE